MGNELAPVLAEPVACGARVAKSGGEAVRPRPRVQAIDRQQGWLRSVVVEELVEEDRSPRETTAVGAGLRGVEKDPSSQTGQRDKQQARASRMIRRPAS
jgi:hypothetical protein